MSKLHWREAADPVIELGEPDQPSRWQREIDHWNRTGKCLRHFSIDIPPRFCEQCGKPWKAVMDGREGRKRRRLTALSSEQDGGQRSWADYKPDAEEEAFMNAPMGTPEEG